ncbi:hypothetical protein FN846DRAFT_57236 [Sphaerosporella brunnea]|uniref:Uncharacterized protein n=1 Tax=Sphaerosporella brunnea TaxID=1250544 RepID=A0A5J5F9E7_9PEZI|nr:hypothetical protein FN846DRAFT_57236 [Sphaerosporella brunnea]
MDGLEYCRLLGLLMSVVGAVLLAFVSFRSRKRSNGPSKRSKRPQKTEKQTNGVQCTVIQNCTGGSVQRFDTARKGFVPCPKRKGRGNVPGRLPAWCSSDFAGASLRSSAFPGCTRTSSCSGAGAGGSAAARRVRLARRRVRLAGRSATPFCDLHFSRAHIARGSPVQKASGSEQQSA